MEIVKMFARANFVHTFCALPSSIFYASSLSMHQQMCINSKSTNHRSLHNITCHFERFVANLGVSLRRQRIHFQFLTVTHHQFRPIASITELHSSTGLTSSVLTPANSEFFKSKLFKSHQI